MPNWNTCQNGFILPYHMSWSRDKGAHRCPVAWFNPLSSHDHTHIEQEVYLCIYITCWSVCDCDQDFWLARLCLIDQCLQSSWLLDLQWFKGQNEIGSYAFYHPLIDLCRLKVTLIGSPWSLNRLSRTTDHLILVTSTSTGRDLDKVTVWRETFEGENFCDLARNKILVEKTFTDCSLVSLLNDANFTEKTFTNSYKTAKVFSRKFDVCYNGRES